MPLSNDGWSVVSVLNKKTEIFKSSTIGCFCTICKKALICMVANSLLGPCYTDLPVSCKGIHSQREDCCVPACRPGTLHSVIKRKSCLENIHDFCIDCSWKCLVVLISFMTSICLSIEWVLALLVQRDSGGQSFKWSG